MQLRGEIGTQLFAMDDDGIMLSSILSRSKDDITDHTLFFTCHLLHVLFHAPPVSRTRKLATHVTPYAMP